MTEGASCGETGKQPPVVPAVLTRAHTVLCPLRRRGSRRTHKAQERSAPSSPLDFTAPPPARSRERCERRDGGEPRSHTAAMVVRAARARERSCDTRHRARHHGATAQQHPPVVPLTQRAMVAGRGGGAWWRGMVAGHGGSSPAAALAAFSRRTTALGQSPPHCRAATAAWSYKGADNTGGGGQSQRCMGLAGLRAQGGLSGTNCQSRFPLAKFIRKFEGGSPTTMARQRLWTMGKAGLHKRAGTSPVNAVVREMIMKRQVHVQSSD